MATKPNLLRWPYKCPMMRFQQTLKLPLQRMEFVGGNSRQRRMTKVVATQFQLAWVAKQERAALIADWLAWHGTAWFEIDLPGVNAGLAKTETAPQIVRLISDIDTEVIPTEQDGFWLQLSGTFESVLTHFGAGLTPPPAIQRGWIIAGKSPAPAAGLVLGGRADAPAAGLVLGGNP